MSRTGKVKRRKRHKSAPNTKAVKLIQQILLSASKKGDLIFETADECLNADEGINLENKIVLSIAIRIKAEQFLKNSNKTLNQTWNLLKKYEEEFNNEKENIEILKRVNLITLENIHINSFMYEPILDMGDGELRELYTTVKDKLKI